jgi:hypothetical protein
MPARLWWWPAAGSSGCSRLDSTLLYLAAPASEFVTGTVVKVDDGQFPR